MSTASVLVAVAIFFGVSSFQEFANDNRVVMHRKMLKSRNVQTKLIGIQFVGKKKDRIAVPLLIKILETDPNVSVRGWAAWSLGEIRDPRSVGYLILALARSEKIAATEINSNEYKCIEEYNSALATLTGQSFTSSIEWQEWQKKQKSSCSRTFR
jgi:HEAT repeat protein